MTPQASRTSPASVAPLPSLPPRHRNRVFGTILTAPAAVEFRPFQRCRPTSRARRLRSTSSTPIRPARPARRRAAPTAVRCRMSRPTPTLCLPMTSTGTADGSASQAPVAPRRSGPPSRRSPTRRARVAASQSVSPTQCFTAPPPPLTRRTSSTSPLPGLAAPLPRITTTPQVATTVASIRSAPATTWPPASARRTRKISLRRSATRSSRSH